MSYDMSDVIPNLDKFTDELTRATEDLVGISKMPVQVYDATNGDAYNIVSIYVEDGVVCFDIVKAELIRPEFPPPG